MLPRLLRLWVVLVPWLAQAHEDNEEHETEDGLEKHEPTSQDIGVSIMLLGSITFMMLLYELVHCGRNEKKENKSCRRRIQQNTWRVLSSTISIFTAVLMFQAINGLVEVYFLEGLDEDVALSAMFIFALLFFFSLQVVLAVICGVVPLPEFCFNPYLQEKKLATMKIRCKTLAVLLGHMAGFATISAFAHWQEHLPHKFKSHKFVVLLCVPLLTWIYVLLLGRLTDCAREFVMKFAGETTAKEENEEVWEEMAEETEDDVAGLAVSFVFVQAMRFGISGVLPDAEGEEPLKDMYRHGMTQRSWLVGTGVVLLIVEALRVLILDSKLRERKDGTCGKFILRVAEQFKNITGMTFSWCFFFHSEWLLSATLWYDKEEGMMYHVIVALFVTLLGLKTGVLLAIAEDSESTDQKIDKVIRAFITAVAILIGFAWERAFDVAVIELAHQKLPIPPAVMKLVLATAVSMLVIPGWYRHMMPTILAYEHEDEDEYKQPSKSSREITPLQSARQVEGEGGEGDSDDIASECLPLLSSCTTLCRR